jgi:hypothetical protein
MDYMLPRIEPARRPGWLRLLIIAIAFLQIAAAVVAVVASLWVGIYGITHGQWYWALATAGVLIIMGLLFRFSLAPRLVKLLRQ